MAGPHLTNCGPKAHPSPIKIKMSLSHPSLARGVEPTAAQPAVPRAGEAEVATTDHILGAWGGGDGYGTLLSL